MSMIDKKSKFLIDKFKISEELLYKILDISESIGTTKYNVWLAKESKKNPDILNIEQIRFVVDWAQIEKPDILSLSFDDALSKSEEWHLALKQNFKNVSNYIAFQTKVCKSISSFMQSAKHKEKT